MKIDVGPLPPAPDPGALAPRGMSRLERWPYNTAALFLLLGGLLLAVGVALGVREYLYRTRGRTTDAVVLRTWGTGTKANVRYRFSLPDGTEVTSTQGNFRPRGATIRIVYVPEHPFLSRATAPDDTRPHDAYITVEVLGLASLALGVSLWRKTRRKLEERQAPG